ncbi:MAG: sulfotransferase [Patescibacteria group bacterium]|nr:sulfotransferase [Patescibacteria group bacterium]
MSPAFIVTSARSGSSLLRWLVDSHPQIACPSETDLALMVETANASARALFGPDDPTHTLDGRRAADALISAYLTKASKKVFCDKSMSNVKYLDLLASSWRDAPFIFLYRHVCDFITSALDAQPWGLASYGFDTYAQRSPQDSVSALAQYWLERTEAMLAFERTTNHPKLRVKYEELVCDGAKTLKGVWDLLGVANVDTRHTAFRLPHDAYGSADHHIWYSSGMDPTSIGNGAILPPARIDGVLRVRVNAALEDLGYAPIDDAWGSGGPWPTGDPAVVEVRVMIGHQAVATCPVKGNPGAVIAVEQSAVTDLVNRSLNIGYALRNRIIRYYGPSIPTYGAEKELFSKLPEILLTARP